MLVLALLNSIVTVKLNWHCLICFGALLLQKLLSFVTCPNSTQFGAASRSERLCISPAAAVEEQQHQV